jgi:putative phospholipid-translocating ATPase
MSIAKKSFKNMRVAFSLFLINLVITFLARRYFLDNLGVEILGMNTIAMNIVGFLSLAELGIMNAISYALYKPISEDNRKSISEIISVQGWIYRKVAYVIIFFSIIIFLCLPILFSKTTLPIWYTYVAFSTFLISSLSTYFVSYVQVLLIADLQEYKVNYINQLMKFTKYALQISAVILIENIENKFLAWCFIEIILSIVIALLIKYVVKKDYPWLNIELQNGKKLKDKHQEIITKIKQIFFHQLGGIVITQVTPVIIYAYISLNTVTKYENYIIIVTAIYSLIGATFSGIQAGIGNLIAQGDKNRVIAFFNQFLVFRYWVISIICFTFYLQSEYFITLWIGKDFVLEEQVLLVLTLYTFIRLARSFIDSFLVGYGLFSDIYAPIIESIMTIGLSIILGKYFGLFGIILGSTISLFIMVIGWKAFFLFSRGFDISITFYITKLAKMSIILIGSILLSNFIIAELKIFNFIVDNTSFVTWVINSAFVATIYVIVSGFMLLIFSTDMRAFSLRVKNMFISK